MKKQLKYAFLSFFGLAGAGLVSGVMYLQSESFANSVKRMLSERSPQKLGVVGDFNNLKLYFFPPGVGIAGPKIKVSKENISHIPLDAQIEAKELRVSFAPIQMFSGVLQVAEVEVDSGAIQGTLYADEFKTKVKPKENSKLSWQDLFRIQIDGFKLEDTYLNLKTVLPGGSQSELSSELVVKELTLKKSRVGGRDGFVSTGTVNAVRIVPPPSLKSLPIREANQLEWNIELSDRGIKINPLTADLSGFRLKSTGTVEGNLLDETSDPTLQAQTEINADLGTFFLANLNSEDWEGEIEAKANVQAKLKHLPETLKAKFTVYGHELEWKRVKADQIQGEGTLDLKQGSISLKNLEVSDAPKNGKIGKLKISASEIPLHFDSPFESGIELVDADIHWLGAAVAKEVAMLDGELTGKFIAHFATEKGHDWRLHALTDLRVKDFALTNQKLNVPKPKFHILRVPSPVKIAGGLEISGKGIDFRDLKVGLDKTQMQVSGGVHSDGFNLLGKGYADLKEFQEIAENPIRGEGELEVKVHGPASTVLLDFDTKLKETSYLGMDFGNVTGRITYDDSLAELRFQNIHANHKNTFYSLSEGFLDLSGGDDLHLPFDLHVGRLEDLREILHKLIDKISWYPASLRGEVHGSIDVSGKIQTPKLKITSALEGSDWTWLGERARRVKMDFGYDQGKYFVRNAQFAKTAGVVRGNVEYQSNSEEMKWDLSTENLSLLDFDLFDRMEIPAKSKLEVHSVGEGKLDHLKSKTEGRFYSTEIKGEQLEPSSFSLEIGESTLRANASVFGNQLSSQLKYALIPKQPSSFRLDLNAFDFSSALLVLNPRLLDDPELQGLISGHIQLDFLSTQSEFARGEIQLKEYLLKKTGFSLKLADPVNVPIQLGYFHFPPTRLKFQNSELIMGGEGRKGDIDFSLTGQSDLAIAEFFTSAVQKITGKADTEIRVHGPLKNLQLSGDLSFNNTRALMSWMQTPFEEIDAAIHFKQGLIAIENFDAYLGEEAFSLGGKIQTFTDRFPDIDLRAQFDDNKIKMAPLDLIQVRGVTTIKGTAPPYQIAGNLEVPQALWTRSFSSAGPAATTRGDRFLPEAQEKQSGSSVFNLDLNVNATQGFLVRNDIVDGEFKGKVRILGGPDNPRLLGEGQLVQGKVLFKDRPFIFESAKIEFDDPYQLNPKFSASAISDVNQYKVRVLAYGRSNSWKAEFSSTPFLPQSEIFSLLASGYTTADTSRYKTRDRSYVSQGEAASLILHSMDFSKDVQNKTGFQFDVEEAIDNNSANSVFRPQNLADNIASPKLVLKRRVGRNISVSFGSTVGVGSQNQKEVNAEYKLTPAMSALGVWNNIEEANTTNTKETTTSFGLDLKFNHRFR